MDALNFLRRFYDVKFGHRDPWRALDEMERRVRRFAAAAAESGIDVVAVVDAGCLTDEAVEKWRQRRRKEIESEKRPMPLAADVLLGDCLAASGIPVVRPRGADADDAIAALAVVEGGIVLSEDSDFHRYSPEPEIAIDFEIVGGQLGLLMPPPRRRSKASPRAIDPSLASTYKAGGDGTDKCLAASTEELIRRGATSSSDKLLGSLHALAKPLRAAILARLGEASVMVEYPIWNSDLGEVEWIVERVGAKADPAIGAILDKPAAILDWLEARDMKLDTGHEEASWRNRERAFNRAAIAAEVHQAAQLKSGKVPSILSIMKGLRGRFPAAEPDLPGMMQWISLGSQRPPPQEVETRVNCRTCRREFSITRSEAEWFTSKGFSLPERCQECRRRRRG
ncbi:hypothetical protein DFJ74DRAFT_670667 [Hyaloraphidium curvatum]|nr:hypothetical protein DFJ74DRAFT_670667 [Hyaloraphidium curvatum]